MISSKLIAFHCSIIQLQLKITLFVQMVYRCCKAYIITLCYDLNVNNSENYVLLPSNPNGEGGNNRWPKYTTGKEHFLNIDEEDFVDQYLHAEDVMFWREVVPKVIENCHD
jgi:hypothetical protein